MNIRDTLKRAAATCFAADLPQYDWKTLNLFRDSGAGKSLLIRLAIATVLMACGLFFTAGGVLWYILLILSVLAAGYDYLAAAILCILGGKPLRSAVGLSVCMIAVIAAGAPVDAAAFMILYRIVTLLIGYVTDRTIQTLADAAGGEIQSSAEFAAPKWTAYLLPASIILAVLVFAIQLWLKEATAAVAIRSALCVLVIASPLSLLAAVPLTWYCAVNGAYANHVLFRSCRAMHKLLRVRSVALDDRGAASGDLPKLVSIKSDHLSPELLLKLAAHAECRSHSRTARAILAAYNGPLAPELIDHALDIPECGTEVYIQNLRICVGTRELMILKGISIPDEDLAEAYVVYVAIADRYAGKILLQEVANTDAKPAVKDLRAMGVRSVTLFSSAQNESVSKIAKSLKAEQLYCKCTPEEKAQILYDIQSALPEGESLLYVDRDCVSHPEHSPANVDACMIFEENNGQFDADMLIMDGDLQLIPDAMETAAWVNTLCREHLIIAAAVKLLLVVLAILGYCTVWFAVVLDGASTLGTLLLAIRAYGFNKPHRRAKDYLPNFKS